MRISELAAAAGVAVPTIKYYLREGLLPEGVRTAATQAEYGPRHVDRLRVIRALVAAGVSVAEIRKVVTALDVPPAGAYDLLGVAHAAVTPAAPEDADTGPAEALYERLGGRPGTCEPGLLGGLAVAASEPNVIYVGMGEATIRGNVSHGDGVYRSTDAGRTGKHLGLEATRNISKVRVHPTDPDVVLVAALGHAHGPNPERGVYRSADGGASWQRVLHRSEDAGASDLCIDPTNPRIVYAGFWQTRRGPYELVSGRPGSGLFRSDDGGLTWAELTDRPGMPKGVKGKVTVAASGARAGDPHPQAHLPHHRDRHALRPRGARAHACAGGCGDGLVEPQRRRGAAPAGAEEP